MGKNVDKIYIQLHVRTNVSFFFVYSSASGVHPLASFSLVKCSANFLFSQIFSFLEELYTL